MMGAGGKEEALQSLSDDEGDEDEEEEEERHDDSIKDEGTTDNGVSFWIKCLRFYNTYTCTCCFIILCVQLTLHVVTDYIG